MDKQTHLLNTYETGRESANMFYGRVIDINDVLDSHRIRVRIKGLDDKVSDDKLPWCEAFLPKFLNIIPQKDELVKIILFNVTEPTMRRQWIGPVISQVQSLSYENYITALSNTDLSAIEPKKSISKIPEAKGVYAEKNEIGLQGRDNSDIIFKEKEILIRAGKFVMGDNTKANNVNPAYIQLKMDKKTGKTYSSIVANKIYLITHEGKGTYDAILTDKTLEEIEKNAHPAVLGDTLLEFMKLMQDFVANHMHPMDLPPNPGAGRVPEILNFDLNSILSENIKIN